MPPARRCATTFCGAGPPLLSSLRLRSGQALSVSEGSGPPTRRSAGSLRWPDASLTLSMTNVGWSPTKISRTLPARPKRLRPGGYGVGGGKDIRGAGQPRRRAMPHPYRTCLTSDAGLRARRACRNGPPAITDTKLPVGSFSVTERLRRAPGWAYASQRLTWPPCRRATSGPTWSGNQGSRTPPFAR